MNRAVIIEERKSARDTNRFRWSMIVEMLAQPQPVTISIEQDHIFRTVLAYLTG